MSETTILGEDLDTSTTDQSSTAESTTDQSYLSQFVGEGKKYSSVEEAAEALAKKAVNADQHIETLMREKQELEQNVNSAKTVEDILAAIRGDSDTTSTATEPVTQPVTTTSTDEDTVRKAVEEMLKAKEEEQKIKDNQAKSWSLLDEAFGGREAAKAAMKEYVGDNEFRSTQVNEFGSFDPESLVRLLKPGFETKSKSPATEDTSIVLGEEAYKTKGITWTKVQQIRKENPELYRSRKFQTWLSQEVAKNPDLLNQ